MDSKFWAKYFRVYDVLNLLTPYKNLLQEICDELEIEEGDRTLEAGCGSCNLAIEIKKRGAEVVGLDYSREALDICAEKDEGMELVFSDLNNDLPFKNNSFDKIASNNTLYTISKKNQIRVLREFKRVLKPGGKVVISNVKDGWDPMKIYVSGIKTDLKEIGLIKTFAKVLGFLVPTIKIFYYNVFILRENSYYFFKEGEQGEKLKDVGFSGVSSEKPVYANQGLMVSAFNPNEDL